MRWLLVTSFLRSQNQPWIHDHVQSPQHRFSIVPATYAHDRSRQQTSIREWLDYLWQAWTGWMEAWRSPDKPVGFITTFPPNAVCVGLIKRLTGSKAPIVAWTFNLSQRFTGRKRKLAAFALARVNVFIVFSRREIITYSEMLGLPRDRFVYVPFTEEMVEPSFAEDTDDPFILAMGTANRDYATMLAAVQQLGLRTVIIAGPRAIDAASVPPNVTVLSGLTLEKCHELCQKARINVVPLDTDDTASGQVTVRYAMMFGKATIATTSIGTEDYIEDGVTGLLVPPNDVGAMAAAIQDLWDNPACRATMGEAARVWLLANAGFEVGPQRMAEILEEVRLAPPV
jgi:glycosyltransferase involved in cell wall biosynthesis